MKRLIVFFLAVAVGTQAFAGFVDLFNGVKVGTQVPQHSFEYLSGTHPESGKALLIDFWETTCEACITSIPRLNEQHAKFSPKGLVVIGVSAESKEVVAPILKRVAMKYAVAVEGTPSLHKALGIRALPYAILVDAKGTIVWRGQPSEITDELLANLVAKSGG